MRGDIPAAAFRLLNALPVRTHEARPRVYMAGQPRGDKPGSTGRMTARQALRIKGVEYESISDARVKLKCSFKTLHKKIASGEAELV